MPKIWERIVADLKAAQKKRGGNKNPYAVATAMLRKQGRIKGAPKKIKKKR